MSRAVKPLLAALLGLAMAAGPVQTAPAQAETVACSYCLVFANDGTYTILVKPDGPYTCAEQPGGQLLQPTEDTRSDLFWPDAGCANVPSGKDMLVYDYQTRTHTWVCSTGWKRLAEPSLKSTYYLKGLELFNDNSAHCG